MQKRAGVRGCLILILLLSNCCFGYAQTNLPVLAARPELGAVADTNWHQVQPGDTYYGLAKKYQVSLDSLLKWNGENLLVGKRIRVGAAIPTLSSVTNTKQLNAATAEPSASVSSQKAAAPAQQTPKQEAEEPANTTLTRYDKTDEITVVNKTTQRVVVIPFDPHLYFSDADEDIARQSRIPRHNVRYIFRARLNAFLQPNGFETLNLLGSEYRNSGEEVENIYKSLLYSYQNVKQSGFNALPVKQKTLVTGPKAWFKKQKEKAGFVTPDEASVAEEGEKYYGVKAKSADFFSFHNNQYNSDYYLFINQFEIHTDYTNCIDRTTQKFTREFLVHYTIFSAQGELVAGNKVKIPYVSNVNDIDKIGRDNLNKIAQRILADLPQPQLPDDQAAQN